MSRYIDAHAHLAASDFKEDIHDVIKQAQDSRVACAVVVAETKDCFERILSLYDSYPEFCMPCLGLHPVQGDYNSPSEARSVNLEDLEKALPIIEANQDKLVAIGEVGLDFTPRFVKQDSDKEAQREVLRRQIKLAQKYDLPINVHSRSAGRPTIALLKEEGVKRALLHAFDGRAAIAMDGVQAGYYFSVPPSIVRSEQKSKLVDKVPLTHLLLETDSPALGPEKQVRNVPANIFHSAEYIAKIKKVSVEDVIRITTENALRLFPKLTRYMKKI
ncbi:unnamed protein product [Owenia fusiformis]|uniref:Uncharacterized protein n=1 Tax=Owenia fusiformis TaxID=6347 RepID=A0A8J1U6G0_OWEFU|nr:unnamed protein product [Owenia fusiformis]